MSLVLILLEMKNKGNKLLRDLLGLRQIRFVNMGHQYWRFLCWYVGCTNKIKSLHVNVDVFMKHTSKTSFQDILM